MFTNAVFRSNIEPFGVANLLLPAYLLSNTAAAVVWAMDVQAGGVSSTLAVWKLELYKNGPYCISL